MPENILDVIFVFFGRCFIELSIEGQTYKIKFADIFFAYSIKTSCSICILIFDLLNLVLPMFGNTL